MASTTFTAYRLHFQGPLHLGRGREHMARGRMQLHSDGLTAGIHSCMARLFGPEMLASADALPAFRLSSAFPFAGEQHYFPVPVTGLGLRPASDRAAYQQQKALRKAPYLSQPLLEMLLCGQSPDPGQLLVRHGCIGLAGGGSLPAHGRQLAQRVSVAPVGEDADATPYFVDEWFSAAESGLFFLAEFGDASTQQRFEAALRLLADRGIGARRSVGYGVFRWEARTLEIAHAEPAGEANHWLNLSAYLPEPAALAAGLLDRAAWKLDERSGYASDAADDRLRAHRRRSLRFLAAGSVFRAATQPLGRTVDLRPEGSGFRHPLWRSGEAIMLPMQPVQALSNGKEVQHEQA